MGRLVVVSNRVALPRRGEPTAGGLAVALKDVLKTNGGLWFGWSGETLKGPTTGEPKKLRHQGIDYATIDLNDADYKGFYAGYSNNILWPLFHFRLGLLEYDRKQAEAYRRVNRDFAKALLPLLGPKDTVWIHDYQLIPMAAELRALGARQRIGFFLHIPFPPWAVFSALPGADRLLRDLLAYDLVGVQTQRDLNGLMSCLREGLELVPDVHGGVTTDARRTQFSHHAIGIDTRGFATIARKAAYGPDAQRMRASMGDRKLIVGAERLDYTKGLPHRLRGFGALLANFPEHLNCVTYLQVAARSRNEVASYRDLKRELDSLAGRINGDYAEFDWTPVRYVARAMARDTLAGLYRLADVGLVTPLRDGMNLVAKEYVAAQNPENPGVLVLSSFAGAAETMDGALLVNPLDPEAMAEQLDHALKMPLEERRNRWTSMMAGLEEQTAARWAENFLTELEEMPVPAELATESARN
ncbi:alpha,alpha-trehalose-phosphate synthase (UDP-forming) [Roseomonas marmotae]|uniref:Trehalose-6-phosphate synthase n=1 Tax=Roseomonas marmotae TaxID=2768161 RepID=A0ABS3KHE6_9PROT|nr:trehalose-6-phosphate synthase [Roseomonas marmotae]MBO1076412.1 trehalose-6-phosphate synthase [Roseomonas marmotae]QTI80750.1 trehalose-6-phosphate synthase [Roseomonas marmotae]